MKKTVLLFLVIAYTKAWACSCESTPTLDVAFAQAKAVFVGRATKVQLIPGKSDGDADLLEYVFEAEELFKGESLASSTGLRRSLAVLTAWDGGGSCGFPFVLGQRYLVYGHGEGFLKTSICSRTKALEKVEDSELRALQGLAGKNENA
jgi:hypothetical protein